jgi:hypothetical protein
MRQHGATTQMTAVNGNAGLGNKINLKENIKHRKF